MARFIVMTAFSGKVNLLSRDGTYTALETKWSVWELVQDELREGHCPTVTRVLWRLAVPPAWVLSANPTSLHGTPLSLLRAQNTALPSLHPKP